MVKVSVEKKVTKITQRHIITPQERIREKNRGKVKRSQLLRFFWRA
jgi:hypothetical protein